MWQTLACFGRVCYALTHTLYMVLFSERGIHYHMSSFNENTGLGILKTEHQAIEFVKYPF